MLSVLRPQGAFSVPENAIFVFRLDFTQRDDSYDFIGGLAQR